MAPGIRQGAMHFWWSFGGINFLRQVRLLISKCNAPVIRHGALHLRIDLCQLNGRVTKLKTFQKCIAPFFQDKSLFRYG